MSLLIGEVNSLLLDQLKHLVIVLLTSVEGRETDNHFIGQDSECPPIDGE